MPFSRERWRALELRRLNPCCVEKRVCHNAWNSRRVSTTLRATHKRINIFCYTVMFNNDVAWKSLFLFSRSSTISEKINVKIENITRRFMCSHGTEYRLWEVRAARAGCEVMRLQEICKVESTWFIFLRSVSQEALFASIYIQSWWTTQRRGVADWDMSNTFSMQSGHEWRRQASQRYGRPDCRCANWFDLWPSISECAVVIMHKSCDSIESRQRMMAFAAGVCQIAQPDPVRSPPHSPI